MSSFQTLLLNFTIYQAFFSIFIIVFTFKEVHRLSKLPNANLRFILGFKIRCILMITGFLTLKIFYVLILSLLSIIIVLWTCGSFYNIKIPSRNSWEWYDAKHSTLIFNIPWFKFQQVFLWVFIDVAAFGLWMLVLPRIFSSKCFFPFDKILIERW